MHSAVLSKGICPSHAGTVSKRLTYQNFFDHLVPHHSSFRPLKPIPNSKGNPVTEGVKYTGMGKNLLFSTEIAVYIGNGAR